MKKVILLCFMLITDVSTLIMCMQQNAEQQLLEKFAEMYHGPDTRYETALSLAKLYENSQKLPKAIMWYEIAAKVYERRGLILSEKRHKEIKEKIIELNKKLLQEVSKALELSKTLLGNSNIDKAKKELLLLYENRRLLGEVRVSAAVELANLYQKQKNEKKSLIWYGNACKVQLDYFYSPQQQAINSLRNKARELLGEGKLEEAIKIYGYGEEPTKSTIKSSYDFRGDGFEELGEVELFGKFGNDIEVIKKLKSSQVDSKLFIEAIKLKNEGNYEAAREKFNFLLDKRFTVVIPFLDAMPRAKKPELTVKEWLKLMPVVSGQWDSENFRIEGGWLEVKKEAEVYVLGTIEELIQDQFEDGLPCLITIAKMSNGQYIIFDTAVFGEQVLMSNSLYIDSKERIDEAFTFAMNRDDTKFHFINKIGTYSQALAFFNGLLDKTTRRVIDKENTGVYDDSSEYQYKNIVTFQPKKALTTPGEAQFEVAKMFETEANNLFGQEKKDTLGIAYTWYKYAYDQLPQDNFKEDALMHLNEVGQKIDEPALISKKANKPLIIEKPKESENNNLQKNLMYLEQKLKNLHTSLRV